METSSHILERSDASWIRSTFLVPRKTDAQLLSGHTRKSDRMDAVRGRQFTEGMLNFADTSLGGNRSINPWPQFTRHADMDAPQLLYKNVCYGMGRQYHESIDQYAQRIWLQFGTPMHNSVSGFLSQAYSSDHGRFVNRGVIGGIVYSVAKLWSTIVTSPIWAFNWAWNTLHRVYRMATRAPLTKFYYIKPGMFFYWSQFQLIINTLTVNMKLGDSYGLGNIKIAEGEDPIDPEVASTYEEGEEPSANTVDRVKYGSRGLPGVLHARNGGIDVRRAASRYQRLANAHNEQIKKIVEEAESYDEGIKSVSKYMNSNSRITLGEMACPGMEDYLIKYAETAFGKGTVTDGNGNVTRALDEGLITDTIESSTTIQGIIDTIKGFTATTATDKDNASGELTDINPYANVPISEELLDVRRAQYLDTDSRTTALMNVAKAADMGYGSVYMDANGPWAKMKTALESARSLLTAELMDGTAWVSFIVDYQGSCSESFSNRFQSSSLEETVNSTSAGMRRKIFDFGGGNLGDNIFADALETVGNIFRSGVAGLLEGAGLGGVGVVGGSAYLDMPDFWENSDASFSGTSYKMSCGSWSAHPYAIMQNVLFPTAAILAAVLPRSTGFNSYSAPLYCKLWSPGRSTIDTGMISDVSIERGGSNVGFSTTNLALSVDISFTVQNLCKVAHMPITQNLNLTGVLGLTLADEDNLFTNYMTALSGLSMLDQYYHYPRWKLKVDQARQNFDTTFSMSNIIMRGAGTAVGNAISGVFYNEAAL